MSIIEGLLIATLFSTCLYASYTDITRGIIPNKILVASGTACALLNFIYYFFFCQSYFPIFAVNFVVLVILSVVMYAFNLWAAGDSKLLFLIVFALPARFYDLHTGLAPSIFVIVFTFSISFIYVVIESIFLRIKNKDPIAGPSASSILEFIKNYIYISAYIVTINYLISYFFPKFVGQNASLISICGLFLSIIIYKYPIFFETKVIIPVGIFAVLVVILYGIRYGFHTPDLRVYVCIAIILFLRSISEKYNYLSIPTNTLKPGMILSQFTIASMKKSRVQGLPQSTTEDMRSRLTQEEVESIMRWQTSKYGMDHVIVVRKVPFAIFMTIGALLFLILRWRLL